MQTGTRTHETRAADKRAFNIDQLRASVAFRDVVIGRMRADLARSPARRPGEGWCAYDARCVSRRVSIECEISREQSSRGYEVDALAGYGVVL